MAHIKQGVTTRARRKALLKQAKGYRGRSKNCIRVARERVEKGLQYAYRDRRNKKRTFRALWIQRINAGCRQHGLVYSQFMGGLIKAGIEIDRKVLSELAISEPAAFAHLCEQAKKALEDGKKASKAA